MWIQQKADERASLSDLQGRAVGLKFECNKCHAEVFTDLIGVPAPDAPTPGQPETAAEGYEIEEIQCHNCGMRHELMVDSTFDGVLFNVSEVAPDAVSYQVAEPEQDLR
ncbi:MULTISPECIES: hypothetical protein [Hymenobacter]|uniref:Uncharacterized protein n=2 Tax=Hymenobacter TaxID=89966 RepID=A0ABS6X4T0_9BACT|nr:MULTISPECIES: hypothetical protein [Hymenobacter]MBO3271718.1 hypothetical protein [Hymenobacter defluvii]MBW3130836.1 hypothetical protein [Hymenobacter profundi]QNE38553.1 hypothetical protein F1C16_02800 [Hymenobacter sp. NBH84]